MPTQLVKKNSYERGVKQFKFETVTQISEISILDPRRYGLIYVRLPIDEAGELLRSVLRIRALQTIHLSCYAGAYHRVSSVVLLPR